ncbi:MAG: tetratricopeptide (TPR) repeat protein [Lentisphaeria bacterium]|jgi:tetratricopeptide (TPR) repeat protein
MNITRAIRTLGLSAAVTATSLFAPAAVDKVALRMGFETSFTAKAFAQAKKKQNRKLPGLKEKVLKQIGKVEDLVSPDIEKNPKAQPNFAEALKELAKLLKDCKGKCNKYELSTAYRYYGYIYASMDNMGKAIEYYDKVVAQSPDIPVGVELEALYLLAQLTYQRERYEDSLKYLNGWINLSTVVGADVIFLRASIKYAKDDRRGSLQDTTKAIDMTEANGRVAKEQWYGLQRALLLEKEDYRGALPVLEKLVRHYPKIDYWSQLSSTFGLLNKELDQLHSLDAVNVMGGLTSRQNTVNLTYLYLDQGVPYKAARVLEKGISSKAVEKKVKYLRVLAAAWRNAKESKKAISVLKEAAALAVKEDAAGKDEKKYKAEEGNIYADLTGLFLDVDDSKGAIAAGKNALKVGSLKSEGEVHTNMGIAYVDLEQYKSAVGSFQKAMEDKKFARFAESWLKHANQQQARKEQLERSLARS